MTSRNRAHRREDTEIAVICALPLEYDAAAFAFDELWEETKDNAPGDYNKYRAGLIAGHHAVLLLLPSMGKVSAASATANLRFTYPGIKLAVLAGICGGVPRPGTDNELILGDVVISKSIIQYDLGRQYPGRFVTKNTAEDSLGRPSKQIRSLVSIFETHHGRDELQTRTARILTELQQKAADAGYQNLYKRPAAREDRLFESDYLHRHINSGRCDCSEFNACDTAIGASCEMLQCGAQHLVPRKRLQGQELQSQEGNSTDLRVVVGRIGSGDSVIKSGVDRDNIATGYDLVAFEMEGAGVWDEMPCIIIKAVCDYADSHKNKKWQNFASATAASATKALLEHYVNIIAPSRTWFLVPYAENPDFVQRPEVVDQIKQLFRHGQDVNELAGPRPRVALYGLGGIGKTQISLAYAFWLRRECPDVSIFWVHASNVQRFRQAYSAIAQECGFPGYDDPRVDVLDLVKSQLERWDRGRWLMIIDNADDTQLFFPPPSNGSSVGSPLPPKPQLGLGRYIPECNHGSILITSRNKQVASKMVRGKQLIEVGAMKEHEVSQLIHAMLDDEIPADEITTLSVRLEHLPLALAQAAAFIQENSISVAEYLQILDESDDSLADQLSEPFEAIGRDSETPHTVTATWAISFLQIQQQDVLASDILSLACLLDRHGIPESLILDFCNKTTKAGQQISTAKVVKALGTLKAFSFISKTGDAISMHRLVQLVTRKWLESSGRLPEYVEHALEIVSGVFPDEKIENQAVGLEYVPHASAVLQYQGTCSHKEKAARALLLHNLAAYHWHGGRWKQTEEYVTQSIKLRQEIGGEEHIDTLDSTSLLALTYFAQAYYKEAEDLLVSLVEIQKRISGEEHPDTLTTLANIAVVYLYQDKIEEAEELQLQLMETTEMRTLGEDHPITMVHTNNLAMLYNGQGKLKEAEDLQLRLCESQKKLSGDDHPSTLTYIGNLASTYFEQGRLEEAEGLQLHVLQENTRMLGEDHPSTLLAMTYLASTRKEQGRLDEAITLTKRSLDHRKERLGENHPMTQSTASALATLQEELDKEKWEDISKELAQTSSDG